MEGRLTDAELRPRPKAPRSSGSLPGPAIPVSPQTAGPPVPERGIGPGGVSGCSAMPGSEKVQPARQSWRFQGGQDTIERHAGLDVVMEKIDQWKWAIPSRERETGTAGVMEGPGESSPRSGVRRGRAPRQPQCHTLGRLAPRHFALRRRPRCPASHGAPAPAEHLSRYRNRAEDPLPPLPGNATPWRVPIPDDEVLSQPPPLLQGCGSNSDGIESGSAESRPWIGTSD